MNEKIKNTNEIIICSKCNSRGYLKKERSLDIYSK